MNLCLWFLFRRRLHPFEVTFVGGLLSMLGYFALAIRDFQLSLAWEPWALCLTATLLLVALTTWSTLLARRRWRTALYCLLLAIPTTNLAGALQLERCPHATWLQLFTISVPIHGAPCHNDRNHQPWWLRD